MRAANLIFAAAVLAFSPMAFAQTETAPPVDVVVETPVERPSVPAETVAPAAEDAAAEEAAVAAPAEPARICRSIERSESRLRSRRERICRTQAEWDAQDQRRNNGSGAEANSN